MLVGADDEPSLTEEERLAALKAEKRKRKDWNKTHEAVMEELVPKATGR